MTSARPSALRKLADRVIVVVWDGMRPDMISAELSPRLHELAGQGTRFPHASSVYPPLTRPASGSISTGCHPGRHGMHANLMPNPADAAAPFLTSARAQVDAIRPLHGGRAVRVETLAEAVRRNGGRFAVLTTGTAGQAMLFDPEATGVMINPDYMYPPSIRDKVVATHGPAPGKTVPAQPLNRWLTDVLLDTVMPAVEPDVAVIWMCEPDNSQHATGLATPESRAAIAANDALLGRILDRVASDGTPTAVIVTSDHGHTTVGGYVDVAGELRRDGFGDLLDAGSILPLEGMLAASPSVPSADAQRLVNWFAEQAWVDTVVQWHMKPDDSAKAVDINDLWAGHGLDLPTAPLLGYTHPWTRDANESGARGVAWASPPKKWRSHHGSLSPDELTSTLIVSGAGTETGISGHPAGIIDIAPTVQAILGHTETMATDGRVLWEALAAREAQENLRSASAGRRRLARQSNGWLVEVTFDTATYIAVEPDGS